MAIEKNKEDLKERLLKGRALSDDELEQVSGGYIAYCPSCGDFVPENGVCTYCSQQQQQKQQKQQWKQQQSLLPNQCPTCGRVLVGGHCVYCGY